MRHLSSKQVEVLIFLLGPRLGKNERLISLLKNALEKGDSEEKTILKLIESRFFEEPFASYLIKAPEIETFFQDHKEFERLEGSVDINNIEKSIVELPQLLRSDVDFIKGKINFMSIHKSKGLQADYVFIAGLTSGILPNDSWGLDTIEAQRRLLFVGMTRALKGLFLVSTIEWQGKDLRTHSADMDQFQFRYKNKNYWGKASRFIEEIK